MILDNSEAKDIYYKVPLIARISATLLVYVVIADAVDATKIVLSETEKFATSLKAGRTYEWAVANACALPFICYLFYFLNFPRPRGPRWLPWLCILLLGIPVIAYLIYAPRIELPSGDMDLEFVIGSIILFFLYSPLWYGLFRRFYGTSKDRRPDYPQCVTCGYNLTGNTSGVCPECGTTVSASIQSGTVS